MLVGHASPLHRTDGQHVCVPMNGASLEEEHTADTAWTMHEHPEKNTSKGEVRTFTDAGSVDHRYIQTTSEDPGGKKILPV